MQHIQKILDFASVIWLARFPMDVDNPKVLHLLAILEDNILPVDNELPCGWVDISIVLATKCAIQVFFDLVPVIK